MKLSCWAIQPDTESWNTDRKCRVEISGRITVAGLGNGCLECRTDPDSAEALPDFLVSCEMGKGYSS